MVPTGANSDRRNVNDLLHVRRGEDYRRAQNRVRAPRLYNVLASASSPTLPIDLTGPSPPKSWAEPPIEDTPAWRDTALSLVFNRSQYTTPFVPTLTLLCLRRMLAFSSADFEESLQYIAPHLRRDLIRHTAVRSPLSGHRLWPLYEPDGHAAGEMIVVGPTSLPEDYLFRSPKSTQQRTDEWDDENDPTVSLHTIVLLSTPISSSSILSLPPSLTTLALLHLSSPLPVHRLPPLCPLLKILDLSYNVWLDDAMLDRVDWKRWCDLQVLGLRECAVVGGNIVMKINTGRWDSEVKVIN